MASVNLRPGDTLNIVWTSVQETPLGVKEVESNFEFTYDDLLAKLKSKGRMGKSRRSGTNGARFSRIVALATNALVKGKWSTGADIERSEVFESFMQKFDELDATEYPNITANARKSLQNLYSKRSVLKAEEQKRYVNMLTLIGLIDS